MPEWKKELLGYVQERWPTRTGLTVALCTVAVLLVYAFAGIDLGQVSLSEWGITIISLLVISILWLKTRLPHVPKGKVGFGVAIQFEDSEHEKRLRSDFLLALRDLLAAPHLRHEFWFVELPKTVAKRITDPEQAQWVAKKANLHFVLYGRARLRQMPQGSAHVIDLRGLVRHAPISKEVSKRFGEDFGKVLPSRLIVGPDGNMFACEFAAKHVDAVARYVIGTAAALSNDFQYAEQLLIDSENRLKSFVENAEGSPISVLLDTVQRRVRELYQIWLPALVQRYTFQRDMGALHEAEEIAGKLKQYDPNNYAAHLCAATCAFVFHRDITQAQSEIEACRKLKDGIWRYSEAFLHAYEGDLESAYRSYQKGFQSPLSDPTVPTQCEEFIQMILDSEPERYWLYYCLGLINYRAKGDLQSARADFRRFVKRAELPRFKTQAEIAAKWIEEITAILDASSAEDQTA